MSINFSGSCSIKQYRNDILIAEHFCHNAVTNEGKAAFLNTIFNGRAQQVSWFIGLIDVIGFVATSTSDTLTSHLGWNESLIYTDSIRIPWVRNCKLASGQGPPTTEVPSDLPNTVSRVRLLRPGNFAGLFLTDQRMAGVTSPGILWSTIRIYDDLNFFTGEYGDEIEVNYTITISNNLFRGKYLPTVHNLGGDTAIDDGPY